MSKQHKNEKSFQSVIQRICSIYFILVLLGVITLAPFIRYACKQEVALVSYAYFVVAFLFTVGLISLLYLYRKRIYKYINDSRRYFCLIVIGAIILIIFQSIIVSGAWFKTGWDVYQLTRFSLSDIDSYLSVYPNQVFLAGLFEKMPKIGSMFGFDSGYLCVVSVSCICVSVSIMLGAFVARRIGGAFVGITSFILSFVFVGLSPWILVPYSDTYGMLWVMLSVFFYVCVDSRFAKWFGLIFSSIVGYLIKPTAIFVLIAIVIIELAGVIDGHRESKCKITQYVNPRNIRKYISSLIAPLSAIVFSAILVVGVYSKVAYFDDELNHDESLGMTHFLMMGSNTDRMGVWSSVDVAFSESFSNPHDRSLANINVWKQRISDMGVIGVTKLCIKKTLTNFADGTFAWECEGGFYQSVQGQNDYIKKVYGIGDNSNLFAPIAQVLWLVILCGVALGIFKKKPSKFECVIYLSLFMLGIFLMIFECRARYLFLYMPCFVALGIIGWKAAFKRFIEKHSLMVAGE